MKALSDFSPDLSRVPYTHNGSQSLPAELHGAIMLLGNFDGLHRGHGELVATGLEISRQRGAPLAMLQCDPHPRAYFSGASRFRVSTGLAQTRLLAAAGIELIYAPRFDEAFAALTPDEFILDNLTGQLGIGGIVVGRDFRFGCRRRGDVVLLQHHAERQGFSLNIIDDQISDGRRISTSSVRAAILAGDIGLATRLMGHAWLTQIYANDGAGWSFAGDQLLPPTGEWPVAALDRAGEHVAYALVEICKGGHVSAKLPEKTALLKWLPTAKTQFAEHTEGRDAYA
ncbi:MAG: hypothetical protein PW735_03245 [Acidobacteriaceae bacterium]|nr:hypothetical protein [Acidobacteriaceae bacterium]